MTPRTDRPERAAESHQFEEATVLPPRADCIADSAGGLTFDVTDPGADGPAHLVLRRRDGDTRVRLPLAPAAHGRLRAALPSSVDLPEGRWDAYAEVAGGEPRRLAPGVSDLRSLVDREPGDSGGPVAVRIPYGTAHGNLSVRSWLRAPHAEAGELHVEKTELDVRGRVYGSALTPDAYVELRPRQRPDESETQRAAATVVRTEPLEFRCTVDYEALAAGVWDLWLRPAGEGGPRVRIARLLDDVADKKAIYTYPKVTLGTDPGRLRAGPYYTRDNDLSVEVTAVE
ncbi:hypothetical protein OK074_7155 [Actinobacteria bacterium OK074]|nr:hypothetical protein OK074_7155 [Actinobacteria bacterium OK074]